MLLLILGAAPSLFACGCPRKLQPKVVVDCGLGLRTEDSCLHPQRASCIVEIQGLWRRAAKTPSNTQHATSAASNLDPPSRRPPTCLHCSRCRSSNNTTSPRALLLHPTPFSFSLYHDHDIPILSPSFEEYHIRRARNIIDLSAGLPASCSLPTTSFDRPPPCCDATQPKNTSSAKPSSDLSDIYRRTRRYSLLIARVSASRGKERRISNYNLAQSSTISSVASTQ